MTAGHWESFPAEFQGCVELLGDKSLSRGYPYEIRRFAKEIKDLQDSDERFDANELANLIKAETERIFSRKRPPKEARADSTKHAVPTLETLADLQGYSETLLVAHFFTREGRE